MHLPRAGELHNSMPSSIKPELSLGLPTSALQGLTMESIYTIQNDSSSEKTGVPREKIIAENSRFPKLPTNFF